MKTPPPDPTQRPLRAVVADDERLMREQLRHRLREVCPGLEIVAEARNGREAVDLTREHAPDVVFLDIRVPGLTGIEAAREIAQLPTYAEAGIAHADWPGCEVVFVTAHDQYAIDAFEQGAVDYLLKPAERERLARTVDRVRERIHQRRTASESGRETAAAVDPSVVGPAGHPDEANQAAPPASPPLAIHTPALQGLLQGLAGELSLPTRPRLRWIQATAGNGLQLIPVEDVLFFMADEKYTRVRTAAQEALIRKPIKELVEELDSEVFWQIHRSTVVNLRAIAKVIRDGDGRPRIRLRDCPEVLEVSRNHSGLFRGM
ncbi:MAG: LytR/AlgR family response regulator transcription factor [Verrucomicrobiota bacterium]